MGVGLATSYGVSELMGKAGHRADPYSTAFVSSASGDVASRYAAIGAQSLGRVALQKFGVELEASEVATETIAKQFAMASLRGTAEGGVAGLAPEAVKGDDGLLAATF